MCKGKARGTHLVHGELTFGHRRAVQIDLDFP